MQRIAVGAVIAALLALGCGGGGGGGNVCVPGMSVSCACANGTQGAQVCTSGGDGYDVCMCSSGSGTAGTTGGAGTTGSGGALGTAGTTGTTGSAGSAATAGTTGTGGSGGSSTGAAGRGGGSGATGSAGTTGTGGTAGSGGYNGRLVTVVIVDSIIAPGMSDGSDWDGIGYVDPSVEQAVATALTQSNAAAQVLTALAAPALANVDKPDPYGDAYATTFGVPGPTGDLASLDAPAPNTFNPIWHTSWYFGNIPIDSDVRITVELWDADLVYPDPIDVVELNSTDLKAALADQQAFEVQVNDQGKHQLLFVGISVTQQAGPLQGPP